MKKATLLSLFLLLPLQALWSGEIWVSPTGSDDAAGTYTQPLLTLRAALRRAREWRRTGDERCTGGITILLRGGTYPQQAPLFIRPEDSGSEASPTLICNATGEEVVISGGQQVTEWQEEGPFWVAQAPEEHNRPMIVRQLWLNDTKRPMASQLPEGRMERMTDFDRARRTILIPTPTMLRNLDMNSGAFSQMEMVVHQRWAIALLRVKHMEEHGEQTHISFCEPESTIEFEHPWPQPVIGGERGNSSYCLRNSPLFLDEPGEWWQDYKTGKIYYLPKKGERLSDSHFIVPAVSQLVDISGTRSTPVHHITFRGISFQYAAWMRPAEAGHVTLQGGFPIRDAYKLQQEGLPWNSRLENQAWIERPEHAVAVSYAHHVNFDHCLFTHLASTALDYVDGVSEVHITDNRFADIGGTAILIGSFSEGSGEVHRPYPVDAEDVSYSHHITISHNTITDATNEDWGCVGIGCGFVRDTDISYNTVEHVNYSGICVGWGWTSHETGMCRNRIRYNVVRDFARQLYDAGGLYTLSRQPDSEMTGNVIEQLGEAPYATNFRGFYIYLDEATDGYTIDGNWCPSKLFGDNQPGPDVKWGDNGPTVEKRATRK